MQEKPYRQRIYQLKAEGDEVASYVYKLPADSVWIGKWREPASFETLGLIRGQINPHYLDTHPDGHMGETREERIQEFVLLHPEVPVVGLREGAWLQVEDQKATLQGSAGARLFSGDAPPRDLDSGTDLSRYLGPQADEC